MMYLMDTDHLSVLQFQNNARRTQFLGRLNSLPHTVRADPSILSVEEQMRGWIASIAKERSAIRQVYSYSKLAELFGFYAKFILVPFDEESAKKFEELKAGKVRIGTMDLKIAATALVNDATVLTANLRDFQKVPGLRVENWLD